MGDVQMSISAAITWLAEQDPDRPAVTADDAVLTRRELDLRTNRLARVYASLGVRPDDMVTVALPNSAAFIEACVAIWKLGATPQPVSSRLPAAERDAVIELAQPSLVVGVDDIPDLDLSTEPLPDAVSTYWKAPTSGGSTGRPKLIVAATPGMVDPREPPVPYMQVDDAQLVPGPLYHNGPFIYSMRGLTIGHHVVVMSRFDAAQALALIEKHRVNWTMLVPTMMSRIWRLPDDVRMRADLSSLRTILHLAAPCPRWLKQAFIDWLGADRIWELYAGTEATGLTLISGREWLEHPGSVGRPAMGSQVRILDAEGNDLPAGEVGEIFLMPATGPGTTYRYVGAEPRRTDGGWDSLGDMGWLDEDGYLYLADRRSDLILAGGANIYPAEVEAALESHPAVQSCAVIGLPDDDLGERVHALIETNAPVTDDELREHLSTRIVRYKVPRSFERVDVPLRDDAGKVRRSALRAERVTDAPSRAR